MKILHTADWHLGKKLHKYDLHEDHKLFLDWLIATIQEREIDVLLIAGDIFDLANPPAEARMLYYWFLRQMIVQKCKIIITGGNHDSVSMLNAPKDILAMLDVIVIGGVTPDIEDQIIDLKEVIVCAIPYLRDADLRQPVEGETPSGRIEAVRNGIKNHYDQLANICHERFPGIPVIAMGHLYANGSIGSESEREIQIGNLASFEGSDFSELLDYVALGHIHRPQRVSGKEHIRYSGSPIALSFSEKSDLKVITELEVKHGKITRIEDILIPKNRLLKKISGDFEKVKSQLSSFQNECLLKAFLEIEVIEELHNPLLTRELNDIIAVFEDDNAIVLKHRISFKNEVQSTEELFYEGEHIDDINETEILKRRLEKESGLSEEHQALLMEAFTELLQKVKEEN
ncbi:MULTISPECIES: exonuclease subunit SbcD [unclassified Arcicella]|uniref:exonuclease subunit SbcD n=1 Tax=unclassified Arcicella TaxID=2644986 RepID=UPI0028629882|nr:MULTISPECIES: exonuclease subunit SbcD [unclassified Arcicella]MDR6561356.1 exonuclease SbcD [Arcicella sp. BE51]MDR6811240.1 exonuclease SbcD [Arcicella sp. BE140]MDR6822590.1 exonuclease SbcD [Arcicella sp. BE139]